MVWQAHADVVPPREKPLNCGRGQVEVTRHGGARCEYKPCQKDADCPSGMPCVDREETRCNPRGRPCHTYRIKRCSPQAAPKPPPPKPKKQASPRR